MAPLEWRLLIFPWGLLTPGSPRAAACPVHEVLSIQPLGWAGVSPGKSPTPNGFKGKGSLKGSELRDRRPCLLLHPQNHGITHRLAQVGVKHLIIFTDGPEECDLISLRASFLSTTSTQLHNELCKNNLFSTNREN